MAIDTMTDELRPEGEDEAPANGHGRRKPRKAEESSVDAMLEYQEAEATLTMRREALREHRAKLAAQLKAVDAVLDTEAVKAVKQSRRAQTQAEKPEDEASDRADSLPFRILAFLKRNPKSAAGVIAKNVGTVTTRVSSALGVLRDRGLVSSSGGRRDMRWSAK